MGRYTDTHVLYDDVRLEATPSPKIQDGVVHLLFTTAQILAPSESCRGTFYNINGNLLSHYHGRQGLHISNAHYNVSPNYVYMTMLIQLIYR